MKLKTIGAAALACAVMGTMSATAFAGMLPGGGMAVMPVPDSTPDSGTADKEPNDIAPAPGADNPTTGAQGALMVIGAAALAGAAVVVSRKKK